MNFSWRCIPFSLPARVGLIVAVAASACTPPSAAPIIAHMEHQASAQAEPDSGWGVVEGGREHYDFTLESPIEAEVGTAVVARLGIATVAPWHLNLEYPATLVSDASAGVALQKARQARADALHFADDGAAFEVWFTPKTAGLQEVSGTLRFAVCESTACLPSSEPFSFVVDVAASPAAAG